MVSTSRESGGAIPMTRIAPILSATAVFATVVCAYLVMAIWYPVAFIWATYEDLVGEWLQFWCFVATFLLSLRLVLTKCRYRPFFALLALGCFYVAMEEISWGQRLFGFTSPEYFRAKNLQGETNLHNMLTGPYSTALKATLAYGVAAGLLLFGLVYPALLRLNWKPITWLHDHGLVAPPLYLWPFFATAAFFEIGVLEFNEAEIAEILVGLALVTTAQQYAFSHRRKLETHRVNDWPAGSTTRFAALIGASPVGLLTLSVLTTMLVYSQPASKSKIDGRIANGVEKFAGRYARYERWDIAASLYQRVHDEKPRSCATLRKLGECHRNLGNSRKSNAYLSQALEIDLRKLEDDPNAASVHRSLVQTYRKMGNLKKAETYLEKALQIGLDRIKEHPDSPNAAYSLGRTYELMNEDQMAFEQFERACELNPTSKKLRKAYYRARKHVD